MSIKLTFNEIKLQKNCKKLIVYLTYLQKRSQEFQLGERIFKRATTIMLREGLKWTVPEKNRRVRPAVKRDQAENKMSAFAEFQIILFYVIA